jgi:hypothetical protein
VICRQAQIALPVLDDRHREPLGKVGERRHGRGVAASIGGDD